MKSLWWLYLLGLLLFAYWPARFALSSLRSPAPLFELTAVLAVAIGALEVFGRWRHGLGQGYDEQGDDPDAMTVLDLGGPIQPRVDR